MIEKAELSEKEKKFVEGLKSNVPKGSEDV
jgi:hypothetical protein